MSFTQGRQLDGLNDSSCVFIAENNLKIFGVICLRGKYTVHIPRGQLAPIFYCRGGTLKETKSSTKGVVGLKRPRPRPRKQFENKDDLDYLPAGGADSFSMTPSRLKLAGFCRTGIFLETVEPLSDYGLSGHNEEGPIRHPAAIFK